MSENDLLLSNEPAGKHENSIVRVLQQRIDAQANELNRKEAALTKRNTEIEGLSFELGELRAEVARHHRDFARVSATIDRSIQNFQAMSRVALLGTLREVRGIVG